MWLIPQISVDGHLEGVIFGFVHLDLGKMTVQYLRTFHMVWLRRQQPAGTLIQSFPLPRQISPAGLITVSPLFPSGDIHPDRFRVVRIGERGDVLWDREIPPDRRNGLLTGRIFWNGRAFCLPAPDGNIAFEDGWVDPDGRWIPDPDLDGKVIGVGPGRSILTRRRGWVVLRDGDGRMEHPVLRMDSEWPEMIIQGLCVFHIGGDRALALQIPPGGRSANLMSIQLRNGKWNIFKSGVDSENFVWNPDGDWAACSPWGLRGEILFGMRDTKWIVCASWENREGSREDPDRTPRLLFLTPDLGGEWLLLTDDRLIRIRRTDRGLQAEEVFRMPVIPEDSMPVRDHAVLVLRGSRDGWLLVPEREIPLADVVADVQEGVVQGVDWTDRISALWAFVPRNGEWDLRIVVFPDAVDIWLRACERGHHRVVLIDDAVGAAIRRNNGAEFVVYRSGRGIIYRWSVKVDHPDFSVYLQSVRAGGPFRWRSMFQFTFVDRRNQGHQVFVSPDGRVFDQADRVTRD